MFVCEDSVDLKDLTSIGRSPFSEGRSMEVFFEEGGLLEFRHRDPPTATAPSLSNPLSGGTAHHTGKSRPRYSFCLAYQRFVEQTVRWVSELW